MSRYGLLRLTPLKPPVPNALPQEEEFRLQRRALEHFLPNTEISLSSLRDLMSSLENRSPARILEPADEPSRTKALQQASTDSPGSTEAEETIDEIDDLHGELGWLTGTHTASPSPRLTFVIAHAPALP